MKGETMKTLLNVVKMESVWKFKDDVVFEIEDDYEPIAA